MKYFLFFLLIIAMGCQQQEAPVEQVLSSSDEEIFLLKPPAQSGPWVSRGDWPVTNFPLTCFSLENATLLAKGTGNIIYTDNDYFADTPHDRKRANAFGWTAQSRLEDVVNGGAVHYNLII